MSTGGGALRGEQGGTWGNWERGGESLSVNLRALHPGRITNRSESLRSIT